MVDDAAALADDDCEAVFLRLTALWGLEGALAGGAELAVVVAVAIIVVSSAAQDAPIADIVCQTTHAGARGHPAAP